MSISLPGKIWRQRELLYKTFLKFDTSALRRHFAIKHWGADEGDSTRRLDYPLHADSLVFDLGAYQGDFAAEMAKKFDCTVYLFEPMAAFHRECVERFKDNPKIFCFNFGLSAKDGTFFITQEANASSIVKASSSQAGEQVIIREFSAFCREQNVTQIDLIKINIEGSEYDVLDDLIATNLIHRVRYLQVQFHDFVQDAATRRDRIRSALTRTHREMWCYFFVWESWERTPED